MHVTKASGARLELSLSSCQDLESVVHHSCFFFFCFMWGEWRGGRGGGATVILSQQSVGLEEGGEGVQCDCFCKRLRRNNVMCGG